MSNKSFLKGAAILGIAGIIVKIMGACFRIPLGNIIGDEGLGYYQAAYPIYVMLLTVSTAGIPTAISKLVSEKKAMGDHYGAHRIFKVSFILLFVVGVITSFILFFGAGIITKVIKNPGAYHAMKAVAPALLLTPVMSAFRGYFQGQQDMMPTALSQIMEQLGRVVIGLTLAIILKEKGLEMAAAGATFGATVGSISGTIIIIYVYYRRRKGILQKINRGFIGNKETASKIIYEIFRIAIPITIGAAIIPAMTTIDVAIVVGRLQSVGFTYIEANSLYGQLSGKAATIINFPQILTVALAMSLVPAISDAKQKNDKTLIKSTTQMGTRIALLVGLPAALGIITLAEPIMLLLYPTAPQSAQSSGALLFILGFGVIFLTLVQVFTGILQGLGKPMIPVMNLFIGAVMKIVITYTLTGIREINIKGAAIGTVVAYAIAALLNFFAVKRLTKTKFSLGSFVIKPVISVIAMSISVLFVYTRFVDVFENKLTTVVAIGVGALIYGLMLITTGGITKQDFEMIPGGRKIGKVLSMVGLLRK